MYINNVLNVLPRTRSVSVVNILFPKDYRKNTCNVLPFQPNAYIVKLQNLI